MANKKVPDLTAASALAGTELIHVVQGGNSRRTTTQDIADLGGGGGSQASALTVQTYSSGDLEAGNAALNIDLSDAEIVEIVIKGLSSTASETVLGRVSTDGGSTLETGSVYHLLNIGDTTYTSDTTQIYFGSATSTGEHYGVMRLVGATQTQNTLFETTSGTPDSNKSRVLSGIIDTIDAYNTLQLYVETGTFDVVDVTVYKYVTRDIYSTDGLQVTSYTATDLETGDTDLIVSLDGYDCIEIIGSLTAAANTAPYLQFSTDNGSTYETASVYREFKVDQAPTYSERTEIPITPSSSETTHHFVLRITGHNQTDFTSAQVSSGAGSGAATRDAYVNTADVYNACKLYVSGTTISSLDVVAYRYNFAGNVNSNAIDGDTVPVDFTPDNYTPDASPAEAGDVDDLAAHLKGIDIRFGHATINTQTGTTYTLVLDDAGSVITMDNASANTVTIPTEASVNFATGAVISVIQIGAGATTITADTGVTLNDVSAGSGDISSQYEAVSLMKLGSDNWIATGGIGAIA